MWGKGRNGEEGAKRKPSLGLWLGSSVCTLAKRRGERLEQSPWIESFECPQERLLSFISWSRLSHCPPLPHTNCPPPLAQERPPPRILCSYRPYRRPGQTPLACAYLHSPCSYGNSNNHGQGFQIDVSLGAETTFAIF